MTDDEVRVFLETSESFSDGDFFAEQTCRKLVMRQKLRQGAIMVSGGIGGLYALGQIVRMPKLHESSSTQVLHSVAYKTDASVRVGNEILESLYTFGLDWLENGLNMLNLMQSPHFFWISFVISLTFLGLYYAYAQEETV